MSGTVRIGDAVGRKVRYVVEGMVQQAGMDFFPHILLPGPGYAGRLALPSDTQVELVEPTLPTTPGSVVRASVWSDVMQLWDLDDHHWWREGGMENYAKVLGRSLRNVTVLYDAGATT